MSVSLGVALRRGLCGLAIAFLFTAPGRAETASVEQEAGIYVTRLSDCMPCHTQPGGTPFAGGLEIGTPFGSLSSPNITPDKSTGIGNWSDDDFYRAVHDGIGHGGEYLYPVMPYTSFTKMTRQDVLAIKSYLFTLKPVFAPRAPSSMDFPFNIRSALFVWRELFFNPGTFVTNPKHSADWNRGAYIVQGPGHCGECHSPRNLLGGTEQQASLSGGVVQQWLAPNISSDPLAGIGDRSVSDIVTFLHSGADRPMGVAFGPMAEVVHNSLSYATKDDLHAVAVYLKEGPDRSAPTVTGVATTAELQQGQHLYLANCAECHQDNGRGIPGVVADLAGNAALAADQPNDVIVAILQGLQGTGGYGRMPSFAGALTDANIADIVNYVRTSWKDTAPANATPQLVASVRAQSTVGAGGTEAARDFDCPKVGSGVLAGALATPAQANFLATDQGAFLDQRITEMMTQLRQQQPGISDAQLTNVMNAAFCPAVANRTDLSSAQKRGMLLQLNTTVQDQITAAAIAPAAGRVITSVPLAPSVAQDINNAAAAKHQSPAAYMADLLAKAAGGK